MAWKPPIMSIMMPPTLCTHFPIDKPTVDTTTSMPSSTVVASATNQVLVVIHAARGPSAYERYVALWSPISDVFTITYSHKFHASMKPTVSLKPSFAH